MRRSRSPSAALRKRSAARRSCSRGSLTRSVSPGAAADRPSRLVPWPPDPSPIAIAPGQESVWDYPRPPALVASDELVTVVLGGVEICETSTSWRVLETSHPPTYYLPRSAFLEGALVPARGSSFCEWKGEASYLDVVGGTAVRAAGRLVLPAARLALRAPSGTTSRSTPAMMDYCLVDGERVEPQPGGFYGGWITSTVVGPFKGGPGSTGW